MMTLRTKVATAAAAVLLTATLASAQIPTRVVTVNSASPEGWVGPDDQITFTVSVEQTAEIGITDLGLSSEDASNNALATVPVGGTFTNAYMALAGVIDVNTNLAGWDVYITAVNGGKLLSTADSWLPAAGTYLQVIKGGPATPAVVRVNACHGPGKYNAVDIPESSLGAGDAVPVNVCNKPALTAGVVIPAAGIANGASVSLAGVLGVGANGSWATQGFGPTATTNGKAHFAVYAGIDADYSQLAGNGDYAEQLEATLVSWY